MNLFHKAGLSRRAALLLLLSLVLPAFGQSPSLSSFPAIIYSGTALTGSIDTKDQPVMAIRIPASWTTANLTFQGSQDATNFFDVYNIYGDEYTVVVGGASRYIVLSPLEFQWARYIKIRSGTTGTPVNQGADRSLLIITRRVL